MTDETNVLYNLGVDISSNFQFSNGDIVLVRYDDNLVQAVSNRLSTDLNELDLFYEDYGSIMTSFLGWRGREETVNFIKAELETVLKAEQRLESWEYDIEYIGNGSIDIKLNLYPNWDYAISTTLRVTEKGVEVIEV